MSEDEPTRDLNGEDPTKVLTEDLPKEMTDSQKLDWLMETLQHFMARDTNRLPPNYEERFAALEKAVRLTNHKLDELNANILDLKAEYRDLSERVTTLESRSS